MSEVQVNIPYQKRHNRISVLLRPILMIPIIIVMMTMIVPNNSLDSRHTVAYVKGGDDYVSYHDNLRQEGVGTFSFLYLYEKGVDQITKIQATEYAPAQILGYEIPVNTLATGAVFALSYLLVMPLISFTLWGFYIVNLATALTIVFRKKYPDWWFSWNQSLQAFVLRIYCYALFITDKAPSLEESDSDIKLRLPNPKEENLGRFMPLIKWILIIPYMFLYLLLLVGSLILVPVSFMAIMLTGKLPYAIYWYQVSIIRFYLRIVSYSTLLVTDKYPKFVFRD